MITINGTYSKYDLSGIRSSQAADTARFNDSRSNKLSHPARHCNICRQLFTPEFKYQLFCGKCRTTDDSFNFNEWLPRVPEQLVAACGF